MGHRLQANVLIAFQHIDKYHFIGGLDQPVFQHARFVIKVELLVHLALCVARRQHFHDRIERTGAALLIKSVIVADDAQIRLNNGENVFACLYRLLPIIKPNTEWSEKHLTWLQV